MIQTEVTVQVFENFDNINKKLCNQGFKICDEFFVNDYYFTKLCLKDLKSMNYIDIMNNTILVREFFANDKIIDKKLVYKKKLLDNNQNVISEEKTQVHIDNINDTIKLLEMAGLFNWCFINNHVYTYKKQDFYFDIHCVKDLGIFLECERNCSGNNLTSKQMFTSIKNEIKNNLNLKIGNDFSCKKAFMKFKKDNNII